MATTLPSSSSIITPTKTLTLTTTTSFLDSYLSYYALSPHSPPPLSFTLLSQNSPLLPIPSDIPASKLIPKTRFVVDGFRAAGDFSVSYFLSHFHSDHYTGLGPSWSKGLIFCSKTTADLLIGILNIPSPFVCPLSLGETIRIDDCDVTAIDANHCPGAVQFLFEVNSSKEMYVHTGDFRFCTSMKSDPHLGRFVGADAVFLDTTYCNPKFVFPSQRESVEYIVSTIERIRNESEGSSESVLFLIATYVVGKERILLDIAHRGNGLLCVDSRKMRILSILGFGDSGVFTDDASASNIHVIGWNLLGETWPYFRPNFVKMREIMIEKGYSRTVGFVSTGWMYETKRDGFAVRTKDSMEIHLVPYSEHSSYDELREYVRFLRPKRVVPTVGADVEKLDGKQALALQKHFAGLLDETANKQGFLKVFHQNSAGPDMKPENVILENVEQLEDVVESLTERGSFLKGSSTANEEDAVGAMKELRVSLPSWVSEDQILCLIRESDGDIVKAATEFYEHELEYYEQADACSEPVSSLQASLRDDIGPHIDSKSPQEKPIFNKENFLVTDTKSVDRNPSITKSNLPKKRGPVTGNKRKKKGRFVSTTESSGCKQSTVTKFLKKGRSVLTTESSGCKQSTITKFFGRLARKTSHDDDDSGSILGGQYPTNAKPSLPDAIEPHKDDVDQFLQIINSGMARGTAASLLEKANWRIDVAVDMFYSKRVHISENEEILVSGGVHNTHTCLVVNCLKNDSEGTTSLSTPFAQRDSSDDTVVSNVSLPIEKYSPIDHACWKAGQPAPYLHLARTFDLVEREKGRIRTTTMLCNMFRSLLALSIDDVLPAVYLCTNKIAADHENLELNIGGSLVISALEEACGTSTSKIKEMYRTSGDLGDVAQECRRTQSLLSPPPLSIHHLFCTLQRISAESGSGSAVRRKSLVANLMRSCREMEIKFLVRTLVRNLRIGAMMKTILPALAQAVVMSNYSSTHHVGSSVSLKLQLEDISSAVAEAFNVTPNLDLLVPLLVSKGLDFSASSLEMLLGMPIPPMLARITNGAIQVLKLFENRAFSCEHKYDGQRAQIHRLTDGSIRVFSRNGKETTYRFPDLVKVVKELCNPVIQTFIINSEIVAIDRTNGTKLMSFQELSSRERGSKDVSVSMDMIKVDICIFIFDVMLSNGERLLSFPLRQRRKYLQELFPNEKLGFLEFAKEITVEADEAYPDNLSTLTKINSFFEDACTSSCEGIMAKSLDIDAGYLASQRKDSWLKVKRDYVQGLCDSLDLVPIGAWHGNGRKAGWYSPFLMACYDPNAEAYQSVCRVMSGFSDAFYIEMKEFFSSEKILKKKPPYYYTDEAPDLWFSPELVWEIRGADFTISPVHHAAIGLVHPSRGISVRLPRYIRSVLDRKPEDCSTGADIAHMFEAQTRKMVVNKEN